MNVPTVAVILQVLFLHNTLQGKPFINKQVPKNKMLFVLVHMRDSGTELIVNYLYTIILSAWLSFGSQQKTHKHLNETVILNLQETESMRVTMEPLLYAAGVDIVLNGHLHEYERTHAVYVRLHHE